MKHSDPAFHQASQPIVEEIAREGQRIARQNGWQEVVIEMTAPARTFPPGTARLRCHLLDPTRDGEIDEPSALLADAADRLQALFSSTGTPLAGARMEWLTDPATGALSQQLSFRYP